MNDLIAVTLLSLLGGVLGLFGALFFVFNKKTSSTISKIAIPFAAGVLITVSITHLLPEVAEISGHDGFKVVLFAFLASFFFEEFFANMHHHAGHTHGAKLHGSVPLVLFGDTIHNFIDGVAIAAAYIVDPRAGIVVAVATFLHEVPHEIGDFGVLLSAGWTRARAFTANFLSALVTIGAAMFTILAQDLVEPWIGTLLAISAGVFLYLGASDFLPELGQGSNKTRKLQFFFLLAGVIVILAVGSLVPEH